MCNRGAPVSQAGEQWYQPALSLDESAGPVAPIGCQLQCRLCDVGRRPKPAKPTTTLTRAPTTTLPTTLPTTPPPAPTAERAPSRGFGGRGNFWRRGSALPHFYLILSAFSLLLLASALLPQTPHSLHATRDRRNIRALFLTTSVAHTRSDRRFIGEP